MKTWLPWHYWHVACCVLSTHCIHLTCLKVGYLFTTIHIVRLNLQCPFYQPIRVRSQAFSMQNVQCQVYRCVAPYEVLHSIDDCLLQCANPCPYLDTQRFPVTGFFVGFASNYGDSLCLFRLSVSGHWCIDASFIHQPISCCSSHSPDTCPQPVTHILLPRYLWSSCVSYVFHFSF